MDMQGSSLLIGALILGCTVFSGTRIERHHWYRFGSMGTIVGIAGARLFSIGGLIAGVVLLGLFIVFAGEDDFSLPPSIAASLLLGALTINYAGEATNDSAELFSLISFAGVCIFSELLVYQYTLKRTRDRKLPMV